MIVITAPTGNIGHQVLANVLAGDQPVRVIARDPARLPDSVRSRVEVVAGSHGDASVVARAFAGADTVFWLLPPNRQATSLDAAFVDFTRPAAEAIRSQGVRRVVSISAIGRATAYAGKAGQVTASLAMDDLLASTGAALRVLAMPSFMDNLLRQVQAIKSQGAYFDVVDADRRAPAVATRDIAAVAARLLLDASWTGQSEVPVLGPEDLSPNEMAAVMSDVLGFPVAYRQVPGEALRAQLTGRGMSEAVVDGMLEMMAAKDSGLDDVSWTPQRALDTPTTFRQWCEAVLRPAVAAA
jgi:uncharacterized protein YbjT (DUF2867 family)